MSTMVHDESETRLTFMQLQYLPSFPAGVKGTEETTDKKEDTPKNEQAKPATSFYSKKTTDSKTSPKPDRNRDVPDETETAN